MGPRYKILIPIAAVVLTVALIWVGVAVNSTKLAHDGGAVHARETEINVSPEVERAFAVMFGRFTRFDDRRRMLSMSLVDDRGRAYTPLPDKGGYMLIHFWATWCAPCITELPILQKFYDQIKGQNLSILTVSLDRGAAYQDIKSFMVKHGAASLPLYLLPNDAAMWDEVESFSIPVSFLVGPNGEVLYKMSGSVEWTRPEAQAFFSSLMAK